MTGYLKALVGALIAGLGSLATGLGDGGLTAQEWIYAGIATLVAFQGIYWTPNYPKDKPNG